MLVFGELCCGMAAVSLALFGGAPPGSRMGAKTGYAKTILRGLGIRPGSGADLVLLNDPDEDIARLWACLMNEEHRQQVVDQIRAWIPCPTGGYGCSGCDRCSHKKGRWDARDLWETLKADRKEGPNEVARWLFMAGSAYRQGIPETGFVGEPGANSGRYGSVRDRCIVRLPVLPSFPALVSNLPAEEIDPQEVARWLYVFGNSYGGKQGRHWKTISTSHTTPKTEANIDREGFLSRIPNLPPIPALVSNLPAEQYQPMEFEGRRVIYIDPPYQDTTGYRHKFPREAVIQVAERWFRAGWEVVISEAEPIDIEGWYHVDISGERTGQKRTFSKQQTEWLTMSIKPEWKPSTQMGLF